MQVIATQSTWKFLLCFPRKVSVISFQLPSTGIGYDRMIYLCIFILEIDFIIIHDHFFFFFFWSIVNDQNYKNLRKKKKKRKEKKLSWSLTTLIAKQLLLKTLSLFFFLFSPGFKAFGRGLCLFCFSSSLPGGRC